MPRLGHARSTFRHRDATRDAQDLAIRVRVKSADIFLAPYHRSRDPRRTSGADRKPAGSYGRRAEATRQSPGILRPDGVWNTSIAVFARSAIARWTWSGCDAIFPASGPAS